VESALYVKKKWRTIYGVLGMRHNHVNKVLGKGGSNDPPTDKFHLPRFLRLGRTSLCGHMAITEHATAFPQDPVCFFQGLASVHILKRKRKQDQVKRGITRSL
jgi:hypothetical protein